MERGLQKRIREGTLLRRDVVRRLGEIAFGRANDCVRLVLEQEPEIEKLDLSLLGEVRCNDKGTVEVKLMDRLRALELLEGSLDEEEEDLTDLLKALRDGEGNG